MSRASQRRREFLTDVLTTAIESGSLGWFVVHEYVWTSPDTEPYAVIRDQEEEDETETHRVDFAVLRKGLAIITNARDQVAENGDVVLHNMSTGQRLYMSHGQRRIIMKANHANEAGDIDAVDALAIVEVGLFGAVTYA